MSAPRRLTVIALLLVCCCSRPPTRSSRPGAPDAAAPESGGPAAAAAVASASATAEPDPLLPDGCYSTVDRRLGALAVLRELASECVSGMAPAWPEPKLVELAEGARADLEFAVDDPTKCVRAIAAGDRRIRELSLAVVDTEQRPFGQDELAGSFALVGRAGPVCVSTAGSYRLVVQATRGSGQVAVQLYRAE